MSTNVAEIIAMVFIAFAILILWWARGARAR